MIARECRYYPIDNIISLPDIISYPRQKTQEELEGAIVEGSRQDGDHDLECDGGEIRCWRSCQRIGEDGKRKRREEVEMTGRIWTRVWRLQLLRGGSRVG